MTSRDPSMPIRLVSRYARVTRQAWRERHTMAAPDRDPLARRFLPAVLELEETPLPALPRVLLWTIVAAFLVALAWALIGRVEMVAVAGGRVIAAERTKVVQPVETGVVRAVHVKDGDRVREGDVLVELDGTVARAESQQTAQELVGARLEAARARGFLAASERNARVARLEDVPDVPAGLRAAHSQLVASQYEEFRAKVGAFDAEAAKRQAELHSTREIVAKLALTLPLAERRAADFKRLVEQRFISEHGYLEREQSRIEQERDLAFQRSRERELSLAVQEVKERRAAYVAEARRAQADVLAGAERRIAALEQDVVKTEQRERLMRLLAPVDGVVQQLAVHTLGGVVTPAQPLLSIVPSDDRAEVEVAVANKDIGFVTPGARAVVKVETFNFTRYGTVPGVVTIVSGDAVQDEKKGLVFPARIRLDRPGLDVDGRFVRLSPGMAISAEITSGDRRVIEYLLSPVIKTVGESARER